MPATERAGETEDTTTPAPRFLPLETISVRLETPDLAKRTLVFGVVSNMSRTGACVITNASLPEHTDICLTISGKRTERVRVEARVVWCAERLEPVKEIVGYLTGVSFDGDMRETVQNFLESGIFQLVP